MPLEQVITSRMSSKQKVWDYFILAARILLAFTFLTYGFGKLCGTQFGLSNAELNTPVKDLSLFRLSWYMADKEPFKAFVGIFQILAALLLLYNRTLLIGALLYIPILANILIFDISYLKITAFYWRLSYYLFLDFLILLHYRQKLFAALQIVTNNIKMQFAYRWWAYILLPVAALILELLGGLIKTTFYLLFYPQIVLEGLKKMPEGIIEVMRKFYGN